jgi:hypothetical protein
MLSADALMVAARPQSLSCRMDCRIKSGNDDGVYAHFATFFI